MRCFRRPHDGAAAATLLDESPCLAGDGVARSGMHNGITTAFRTQRSSRAVGVAETSSYSGSKRLRIAAGPSHARLRRAATPVHAPQALR